MINDNGFTFDQVNGFITETTSFLRDLKLKSVLEDSCLRVSAPKRNIFSHLYKSYRKINELTNLGGVITGSRALKFYNIGKVPLLSRKVDDWDIMIDKKSLLKFCADNKLNNIKYDNDRVSVSLTSGLYTGSYGYISKRPHYLFAHDLDIIAKDEIPPFIECDGYRIATIEYILSEKVKIIQSDSKSQYRSLYDSKHIRDCIEIMVKMKTFDDPVACYVFVANTDFTSKNLDHMIKILKTDEYTKKESI